MGTSLKLVLIASGGLCLAGCDQSPPEPTAAEQARSMMMDANDAMKSTVSHADAVPPGSGFREAEARQSAAAEDEWKRRDREADLRDDARPGSM